MQKHGVQSSAPNADIFSIDKKFSGFVGYVAPSSMM
jgi:hypothetical protein